MKKIQLQINQKVNGCILGMIRTGTVIEVEGNDRYCIAWHFLPPNYDSYTGSYHIDQLIHEYIDC